MVMVNGNGNNVFIERLNPIRKFFLLMLYGAATMHKKIKHDVYIFIHPIQYLKFIFRWQEQ